MQTTIEAGPHFRAGDKLEVHPRVSDQPTGAWGNAVKKVTVPKDGSIKIDGLVPLADYFLVNRETGQSVAIVGAGKAPEALAEEFQAKAEANAKVRREAKVLPAQHVPTVVDEPESWGVPSHNFEKSDEAEPQPHVKQADVPKGTPQRSSTPIGQATPADPDEWQPRVPQHAVKKGTPQRSDTELGEATPVDPNEVQPALPQDEQSGKQRSDTPEGEAAPTPRGSKVEQEKAKDSSVSKAQGATVPVAGTDKVKGRTRQSVSKPVARKAPKKSKEA